MPDTELPLLPLVLDDVPWALRQALLQEGIPVRDRRPGVRDGRFLLFDSRHGRSPQPGKGQIAIDVNLLDRDGDEPLEALADQRSRRVRWEVAGLALSEEVARVDKRRIRRGVLEKLRTFVERAGGIWLRLAAFPFPYRSALNFRIDHDEYDPGDLAVVLDAIAGNEGATTHFVCAAPFASHPDALDALRGLDIGSHGYWHHTYRTAEENLRNIGRGIDDLEAAGLEPVGFAAPHGRFNRGLLAALESLGIDYSSEFGLVYDELPLWPLPGKVLQVPVHPVCLGLFLEAAMRPPEHARISPAAAAEAALDYFRRLAYARYQAGEPIFLYGHPTGRLGRHGHVLRGVFETAGQFSAVWKTSLSQVARWWRSRSQVQMSVRRSEGGYTVKAEGLPPGHVAAIEYCRGPLVGVMPLERPVVRFAPGALAYQSRGSKQDFRLLRVDQPEPLKTRILRFIDWERVTPVEEIGHGDWRNWVKRTLRRMSA